MYVPTTMSTLDYGNFRLISKPQKHQRGWVPFVLITWLDSKYVRSHIENPDMICATEDLAVDYGFEAARAWITNEALSKIPSSPHWL